MLGKFGRLFFKTPVRWMVSSQIWKGLFTYALRECQREGEWEAETLPGATRTRQQWRREGKGAASHHWSRERGQRVESYTCRNSQHKHRVRSLKSQTHFGANSTEVKRKLCTYQRAQLKAADACAKGSNSLCYLPKKDYVKPSGLQSFPPSQQPGTHTHIQASYLENMPRQHLFEVFFVNSTWSCSRGRATCRPQPHLWSQWPWKGWTDLAPTAQQL